MSQPARTQKPNLAAPFGEADLEAERFGVPEPVTIYPPRSKAGHSDIQALTVPPGEFPSQNLPGSIEEAVLAALDQVPRAASAPQPKPAQSEVAPADEPDRPAAASR